MSRDEESVLEADPLLAQTPAVSRMERLLYYLIWIWRICIFAVTGSSSMAVTRAILTRALQMESGTWYYYVVFFFLELVVYTIMLILIGTCLGQWKFFCNIGFRMWGWMFPQRICRCFNDKFKQSEEK